VLDVALQPPKLPIEFRDSQQASVHGGQLTAAAQSPLEQFGLVRARAGSGTSPHQGKRLTAIVYVTQLLHCFTGGHCPGKR